MALFRVSNLYKKVKPLTWKRPLNAPSLELLFGPHSLPFTSMKRNVCPMWLFHTNSLIYNCMQLVWKGQTSHVKEAFVCPIFRTTLWSSFSPSASMGKKTKLGQKTSLICIIYTKLQYIQDIFPIYPRQEKWNDLH